MAGAAEAGSTGAAGVAGQRSQVDKVLEAARKAERPDDRINAVRWLGDNGTAEQFDALQDIQINDPSPEVRAAAELAVNTLRTRRANDAWPGVTPKKDPQDYMRSITSPTP
jgi:HEAT repeat protein